MATDKDFSRQMHRIAEDMGRTVEEVARGTIIDLFSAIIRDTPVDVGRLQGNWQTSVGSPASGELGRTGASEATLEVLTTIRQPDVYFFTNNMPYAERIEFDGWSHTKAPEGMVRINIDKTEKLLNARARRAR
jgi:hypothetical protein